MPGIDINAELHSIKEFYKQEREENIEELKEILSPIASEIKALEQEKSILDVQSKDLGDKINKLVDQIRNYWQPFIAGADEAKLELSDGQFLVAENKLTVSPSGDDEAEEKMVKWFEDNGYDNVLKKQIHTQTRNKIAREKYGEHIEIPGLKYSKFLVVKIK